MVNYKDKYLKYKKKYFNIKKNKIFSGGTEVDCVGLTVAKYVEIQSQIKPIKPINELANEALSGLYETDLLLLLPENSFEKKKKS